MSRVLVTGGAGAIGGNLVRRLLELGDEVVVLDDLSSGRVSNLPDGARLVRGSVTDSDAVATCFDSQPERVFHLAALFANQNSVEHPELDLEVNGLGTLRILSAARDARVAKVLLCSSSCVYGSAIGTSEDDLGYAVDTPYALTKRLSEGYAQFWARHHGLDVVVVRPFNSYGPGEHPGRYRNVIPNFLASALRGESIVVTGTGDETRDFTYVDDIVGGLVAAMAATTEPGATFNLASGRETRIADLAVLVNELTGNRAPVAVQARRAWDSTARRVGDIRRAREAFGFAPSVTLEDGLRRTLEWMRGLGA